MRTQVLSTLPCVYYVMNCCALNVYIHHHTIMHWSSTHIHVHVCRKCTHVYTFLLNKHTHTHTHTHNRTMCWSCGPYLISCCRASWGQSASSLSGLVSPSSSAEMPNLLPRSKKQVISSLIPRLPSVHMQLL